MIEFVYAVLGRICLNECVRTHVSVHGSRMTVTGFTLIKDYVRR